MSLYDDLGVSVDAPAADIKRAYKRKAAKTHPDKGGSTESFQVINHAYAVLSDETKRARYDSTGVDDEPPDLVTAARSQLASMFTQLVEANDPDTTPFIERLQTICKTGQQQTRELIREQEKKLKRLETAKRRLGRAKKAIGPNFLLLVLEQQLKTQRANLEAMKNSLALGGEMLKLLMDYEYSADKIDYNNPLSPPSTLFTFTTR